MKKETIEKLFKRYISIFDDVVYQTTDKHLDQTTKDEINSEVDLLFKEYEHISNLTEFNSFSEKIKDIIDKVLKKSKYLNKAFIEKELRKRFNLFENDPFVYIQKEIDDTVSKIIPNSDGSYYIPVNPYLESCVNKGYRVNFETSKIKKHIDEIEVRLKAERAQMITKFEEEYKEVLKTALKEINDCPIQFCKETIEKYFYNGWIDKLLQVPNSIKNQNIIKAINLNLTPHTKEYEDALNCAFISKYNENTIIKLSSLNPNTKKYLNDFMIDFRDNNLLSRSKIIDDFCAMYSCVYNNEGLTKSQKMTLKGKLDILLDNVECMLDISYIRFYKFALEHNLINLDGEFLTNKANAPLVYNMLNINLTLLINELETVKLSDNGFILNEKYNNIINDYYEYIEKNKNELANYKNNVGESIFKISVLDSLVNKFNKQYKYKYIFKNIKAKIKSIIKIKK